jgi:OOP family OmpA-OmpF porin
MRKATVLGVLGLAGTLASPAFADDYSGFRMGVNLGSDKLESDFFDGPSGAATTSVDSINTDRLGYGLFGGWALNKWLAVEAGLVGGTEFNTDLFTQGAPTDSFDVSHVNLKGVEASAVGSLWIGKKFAFFGRAGFFGYKVEASESFGSYNNPSAKTVYNADDTGYEPLFGVGIQTVLDTALVRLEYKMTSVADLGFFDNRNTASTADDVEVHWRNSDVSSLTFSIVWILQ